MACSEPGTTGTPAAIISRRARVFSPMAIMDAAEGPMKVSPAAATASENAGFSERKP